MTIETNRLVDPDRYADIETVILYVGENKAKFFVYREQLCEVSLFFKTAFNSVFKEGVNQRMHLPEDDVDIVDIFIDWLYTGHYELPDAAEAPGSDGANDLSQPLALLLFSEKYSLPRLEKHVLKKILALAKVKEIGSLKFDPIKLVYENTRRGAPIRKLMSDWWANDVKDSWYAERDAQNWLSEIPDFAVDLVACFARSKCNCTSNQERKLFKWRSLDEYLRND